MHNDGREKKSLVWELPTLLPHRDLRPRKEAWRGLEPRDGAFDPSLGKVHRHVALERDEMDEDPRQAHAPSLRTTRERAHGTRRA